MISYAQNFEDVMLARAFPGERGVYVDVGANDPVIDNVTYHFYERGWRGINIEPQTALWEKLCAARPGDVNLAVLAGSRDGEMTFYEIETWHGLSTLDPDIAARHAAAGYAVTERRLPCRRLDGILAEHLGERPIDFMSIDAEGAEADVLAGLDLARHPPKVVVIEAMMPLMQQDRSGAAAAILEAHGYECVYEDGLNRFFLASEAVDLKPKFRYPPNVFDGFRRRAEVMAERELAQARARMAQLEARIEALTGEKP
jgi:FkbM family methyltransferase